MTKLKKTFTLVELIVVIAILAILSVTSFVVLSQWFVKARNVRRTSDLQNLKTALNSHYFSRFEYPHPWEEIEILNESGIVIWYQGLFDESVGAQMDELTKVPKDPLDKDYYWYSILTKDGVGYELVAFLEVVDTNLLGAINNAYAVSLSSRIPYVIWEYVERWWFHLKPLTFIHPDYWVITSQVLGSGGYIKVDTSTLTGYETDWGVVGGVEVEWWEYWVASVIEVYPSSTISIAEVGQALPVVGGVAPSVAWWGELTDDELLAMFEDWSEYTQNWWNNNCDVNNMVVDRTNFSGGRIWSYTLNANTIYWVPNGVYELSEAVVFNWNCIWLVGQNRSWVVFSGSPTNGIEGGGFNNILTSITIDHNAENWIARWGVYRSTISNLELLNNGYNGLQWEGILNGNIKNILSHNNGRHGLYMYDNNNSVYLSNWIVSNIKAYANNNEGVSLYFRKRSRYNNLFENIETFDNGGNWVAWNCMYDGEEEQLDKISNIVSYSNSGHGVYVRTCEKEDLSIPTLIIDWVNSYDNFYNGLYLYDWRWYEINNIKSYQNWWVGIFLYSVSTSTWDNWNTYQNNMFAYSDQLKWYWNVRIESSSSNVFENIVSYNASYNGVDISDSNNNTFNNLKTYSNSWAGIKVDTSNDNKFINIKSYNNGEKWLIVYSSDDNLISNSYFYENSSQWIEMYWHSQENIINKVVAYNNYDGIVEDNWGEDLLGNYLFNVVAVNNQHYGINTKWDHTILINVVVANNGTNYVGLSTDWEKRQISNLAVYNNELNFYLWWKNSVLDNITSYSAGNNWIKVGSSSDWNTYYDILRLFENSGGNLNILWELNVATSSHPETWWQPGQLIEDQDTMWCDWVINPVATDWSKLLDGNCDNIGYLQSFSGKIIDHFEIWSNIPTQHQPYIWENNNTSNSRQDSYTLTWWWTDGIERDSTQKIGEW